MSYYTREEQETLYLYDAINGNWRIYSTFPPHIRQILERGQIFRQETDDQGRIIAVEGYAEKNQVRLFRPVIKEDK